MCGKGSTSQTTTYQPPAAVTQAYEDLIGKATPLASQPYPQYGSNVASGQQDLVNSLVAPMSPNQLQAGSNIGALQGYSQPYINAATGLDLAGSGPIQLQQFSPGAVGQYMSPYLGSVLGSTVANINETNAQQNQQLMGNAIQRGAWGGDRAGIAQSELARQQGLANNATIANILNSGYGQALGEFNQQQQMGAQAQLNSSQLAQAGATNLANLGGYGQQAALQQANAQYGYGTAQQQQQQAGLSTAYQQYLNQNAYPYQQLGWLGSLVSGAASGMGGTTTGSIPQPGTANQIIGGLGALGSIGNIGSIGSSLGSAGSFLSGSAAAAGGGAEAAGIGSTIMDALMAFSDERLKKDIRPIGKTFDGQNIYSYKFKNDPVPRTHLGLMAQEVEHNHPSAVGEIGGLKTVNYEKATSNAAELGEHHRSGYADGGSTDERLRNYSPIAGLSAANMIPSAPTPQGSGFHPVANANVKNPNDLDTQKLKSAVQGIKSLMGKSDKDQPQALAAASAPSIDNPSLAPTQSENLGGMYASGGSISNYYGMPTKEDIKNIAEDVAGSGISGVPGSIEAVASEDLLHPTGNALGGAIMKSYGGPTEGDQPPAQQGHPADEFFNSRIIRQESGGKQFDANGNPLTSSKGAIGVAQVMPNTAVEVAKKMGIPFDPQRYMNDPEYNATLGRQYYRDQYDRYGNHVLASAAYNSGPGNVDKAIQRSQATGQPITNFLPEETRNYMASVSGQTPPRGTGPYATTPARTTGEAAIPTQSTATKEGLFGALGIAMTPEQRLASFNAFATLAGTPGKFGVGLAAAANAYSKTLLEANKQTSSIAQSQAEAEKSRAGAELSRSEAQKNRTIPGATGILYAGTDSETGKPTFSMIPMPKPGGEPTTFGQPAQTQPAAGAPTAPTGGAPAAPNAPAPTPKPIDLQHGTVSAEPITPESANKDDTLRKYGEQATQSQFSTHAADNAKRYQEALAGATGDAQAAANSSPGLQQAIQATTQLPSNGALAPGAGAAIRYAAANYFKTLGDMVGMPINETADTITNQQVLQKLSTLQSQAAQKGLGREAGFWLQALSRAYPSENLTKEASADILANMIVSNGRSRDYSRVATTYGRPEYGAGLGYNVQEAFNSVNPAGQYAKDQQIVRDLLLQSKPGPDGKLMNPITMLQQNPSNAKAFDDWAIKNYKVYNLSRYFVS